MRALRNTAWLCAGLLIFGAFATAADPKDDKSKEEQRYDNKDLEKLKSKAEKKSEAQPPAQPQAAPAGTAYSNADLSSLPEPTKLPDAPAPTLPTYTNKDLGPATPSGQPPAEPTAEADADAPTDAPVADVVLEAAKTELAEAQANVDELEARLRAVRNPFLPRPMLPAEEEQAWKGLNNAERSARVELQLKEARDKLAAAIEKLSTLQPR